MGEVVGLCCLRVWWSWGCRDLLSAWKRSRLEGVRVGVAVVDERMRQAKLVRREWCLSFGFLRVLIDLVGV